MIPTSRRVLISLALGAALPLAASAQAPDPALAAIRAQWSSTINYITRAAEEMTEADYAFKPVPTVRSFGELIGHVAGSQHMICAAALGEPQPAEDAVEKSAKTKAALVTALNAVHDGEHYGNIVTYMRMKGLVPPSSK